jgi:N-hydroxyarylamine O-acetyltransferase
MDLFAYFDRIGYRGAARTDLETLVGVHRAHAQWIPFENLDVQLGRPPSRAPEVIFEKIVRRRRGGWCFENNGLLAGALEAIGFSVHRLAAGVGRVQMGAGALGNHLTLLVDLEGTTYLCDVGFGNAFTRPVALADGTFRAGPFDCRIESLGGGWRRFSNGGDPFDSFDFHPDVKDEALLEAQCAFLGSDPQSPFVLNAVAQMWRGEAHQVLRGRRFIRRGSDGEHRRLIVDADDYVETLRRGFDINLPEAGALWDSIVARDQALFSDGD